MNGLFPFLVLYVVSGLVIMGVCIPMIQRRIPPNHWYGFRVPKTLSSPNIWYPANVYCGKQLYQSGLRLLIVAFALALIPGMNKDIYAIFCTIVMTFDMLRAVVLSFQFLRTL